MANLFKSKLSSALFLGTAVLALATSSFAQAAEKPVFNILTYDEMIEYKVLQGLIPKFEDICKCEVKVETTSQHKILNNFLTTYKKAKYDVLLAVNINDATRVNTDPRLRSYFLPVIYDINTLTNLAYGATWNNQKALPLSQSPATVVYNNEVPAAVQSLGHPISFKDWVEKDKTSFIFATPETNDLAKALSRMIAVHYPTYAEQVKAWELIKAKTKTVGTKWSTSYIPFTQGESDSAMGYGSSRLYHVLVDNIYKFDNVNFKDGMPYLLDSLVIPANTKQPVIAQQFAKFMLSPEAQQTLFIKNASYPVVKFGDNVPKEQRELADTITDYKVLDVRGVTDEQLNSVIKAYKAVFAK